MIIPNSFKNPKYIPQPIITGKPNRDKSEFWWSVNYKGELTPEQQKLKKLSKKLLSFGGEETVLPPIEEDLKNIMDRGFFLYGKKSKPRKGLPSQCHLNSCDLYDYENRDDFYIMTGYALSNDGLWRQHSWCYDSKTNTIIETTEKRIAYFGFLMTHEEANDFCSYYS